MLMLFFVIGGQLLTSLLNVYTRMNLSGSGDFISQLFGWWCVIFFAGRVLTVFAYLYVIKKWTILKSMAMYTALDVLITVAMGHYWLGEVMDLRDIASVTLVFVALILLQMPNKPIQHHS